MHQMVVPATFLPPTTPNFPKKNSAWQSRAGGTSKTKMTFPISVAPATGSWQGPRADFFEPSPDATRLLGPMVPSGVAIGTTASFYVGDGWRSGIVVATGITSATIATTRFGTSVVSDRRNLLIGAEAGRHRRALAKWQRDHGGES